MTLQYNLMLSGPVLGSAHTTLVAVLPFMVLEPIISNVETNGYFNY
jgi:hypothetical protein